MLAEDDVCRTAMFRSGRLRLLMTLAGLQLVGDDVLGASWIIPSSLSSPSLRETRALIEKHCENLAEEIDGAKPRDLLRRKRVVDPDSSRYEETENVQFGSESEGDEDGILFPANLPERSKARKTLKQRRRRKQKDGDDDEGGLDEETLEARRKAREDNALARQRKIKSDLYVHASDDESDEEADVEFFANEEMRRKAQAQRVLQALSTSAPKADTSKKRQKVGAGRKRKAKPVLEEDEDDSGADSPPKRRRGEATMASDSDDDLMVGMDSTSPRRSDTPLTSADNAFGLDRSPSPAFPWSVGVDKMMARLQGVSTSDKGENNDDDDDGDDSDAVAATGAPRRRRAMAGFIIGSDSE